LSGAICFIELGTSIKEPGCDFAYTVFVGWHAIAFSFMWVSVFITFPASAAVQAQTFGHYISKFPRFLSRFRKMLVLFFPVNGIAPLLPIDLAWHDFGQRSIGYALLVVLTILNFYSLDRFAAPFQVLMTSAKMLAMAIIMFTGFYYFFFENWTHNLEHPMEGSVWAPGKLALAFYGGLWSYAGWDILNYGTPEIHKPTRTMPLSLISGILIVCFTYVAINLSYFVALSPDEVKNSSAVASVSTERSFKLTF
uniref:Aa_trans domain-containing protein n=1 Tax=Angiostrongylus cantonensis TaxID=6313 RepID=A0A0K0DE61_ANGCA